LLAKEAKVSQDVLERFKPALEKIKESSQEVYKGEEYLARVKQSKELGIFERFQCP
jgi:polyribonucleotide nucleotidyltransferase